MISPLQEIHGALYLVAPENPHIPIVSALATLKTLRNSSTFVNRLWKFLSENFTHHDTWKLHNFRLTAAFRKSLVPQNLLLEKAISMADLRGETIQTYISDKDTLSFYQNHGFIITASLTWEQVTVWVAERRAKSIL